ncbi:MAG: hypothetical protein KAW12_12940 [Candidatus Aminicenantes bacterium]|nr:hypothetical protein [Candidatus Aminicenantes bacterium]
MKNDVKIFKDETDKRLDAHRKKEEIKDKMFLGCVVLVIIGTVILLFASVFSKDSEKVPPKPKRAELKANVRLDNGVLVIKNLNRYTWTPRDTVFEGKAIVLEINSTFEYLYRFDVKPNDEIRLLPTSFTKDEGLRFNFFTHRLHDFTISCTEGFGSYGFR